MDVIGFGAAAASIVEEETSDEDDEGLEEQKQELEAGDETSMNMSMTMSFGPESEQGLESGLFLERVDKMVGEMDDLVRYMSRQVERLGEGGADAGDGENVVLGTAEERGRMQDIIGMLGFALEGYNL